MDYGRKEYQCDKKGCTLFFNATEDCVKPDRIYCPYCGTKIKLSKKGDNNVECFTVKLVPEGEMAEVEVYANDKQEAEDVVQTLINEDILQNVFDDVDNSNFEVGTVE